MSLRTLTKIIICLQDIKIVENIKVLLEPKLKAQLEVIKILYVVFFFKTFQIYKEMKLDPINMS